MRYKRKNPSLFISRKFETQLKSLQITIGTKCWSYCNLDRSQYVWIFKEGD